MAALYVGLSLFKFVSCVTVEPKLTMSTPAWTALDRHFQAMKDVHMRSLFDKEPARFDQYSLQVGDILLDYSKNRTTAETMQLLTALAAEAGVCEKRDAMFSGARSSPFLLVPAQFQWQARLLLLLPTFSAQSRAHVHSGGRPVIPRVRAGRRSGLT